MSRPSPVAGEIQEYIHEPYGDLCVVVQKEDGTECVERYKLHSVEEIDN